MRRSNLRIEELPKEERPRERCLAHGGHTLSLRECFALILSSGPKNLGSLGLAQNILEHLGGAEEVFFRYVAQEDQPSWGFDIPGIGPAKSARILACIELCKRYASFLRMSERDEEQQIGVLDKRLWDRIPSDHRGAKNEWIGFVPVFSDASMGGLTIVEWGKSTNVVFSPADFFGKLLLQKPFGFFMIHNHPSGICEPSEDDKTLTETVRRIAGSLGIALLGHKIVTARAICSV